MKKYSQLLILITALLFAFSLFFLYNNIKTTKRVDTGWARYANTELGFSFEYPFNEISPTPDQSYGNFVVRLDSNSRNPEKSLPAVSSKIVVISPIPDVPVGVVSVDDWINLISERSKTSVGGNPFTNLRYEVMGKKRVAIFSPSERGASSDVSILFFYNKQLYSFVISNFPVEETERIWKSFKFLNNSDL
ncbi:MAG: hypothetical protein M0P64_03265 [Candidatus Pacebacteria bacterium]|jgi:hypothetical protein|nr:hypothetical protein [Candidatus Paceibacterota bacterium]